MELFEAKTILLFILFFIPGFISMKVYNLLIASEKTNFSQSISEALAFSSINYALLSWLIVLIYKLDLFNKNLTLFIILLIFIIFLAPVIWTILFVTLSKAKRLNKYILNPIKTPWDFFFEKRDPSWVIINLKNGKTLGGIYNQKSYASEFPFKEQIYLEQQWYIDKERNFLNPIPRSNGILILGDEIESIEFFK